MSCARYVSQVLMADLLIGENIENNFFVQNTYFGKAENFDEDFNKTIKTSNVKFSDYLDGLEFWGQLKIIKNQINYYKLR